MNDSLVNDSLVNVNKYIVIDLTRGRQVGCILAKSLHAAKCLSPKLFGFSSFNRVYAVNGEEEVTWL